MTPSAKGREVQVAGVAAFAKATASQGACYVLTKWIVVAKRAERQSREVQRMGVGPHAN